MKNNKLKSLSLVGEGRVRVSYNSEFACSQFTISQNFSINVGRAFL
jgi:hypothetical protein